MTTEEFVGHVKKFYAEHPELYPLQLCWIKIEDTYYEQQLLSPKGCCGSIAAYCDTYNLNLIQMYMFRDTDETKIRKLSSRLEIDAEWLKGFLVGWDGHEMQNQPEGRYKEGYACGKQTYSEVIHDRKSA